MRACSATDHQNGSDYGWKSNRPTGVFCKNVVFLTNVQRIFKRTVTDLNTQPATTQQRLTCAQKRQVAAASKTREMRSSSVSTGDM